MSLGTPVEIKRKGKGGTIAIAFTNENELQRLYEYLTERSKRHDDDGLSKGGG